MNAPKGVKPSEFIQLLDQYFNERCNFQGHQHYTCKKCGTTIRYAVGVIALHDERFSVHVDRGEVEHIMLPWCPVCEGEPDRYGCMHVGDGHDGLKYTKPAEVAASGLRGLIKKVKKALGVFQKAA